MASIGSAFIQIVPSIRGLDSEMQTQLSPLSGIASKAGADSGKALGSSFSGAGGALKAPLTEAGGHFDGFKSKATGALDSVGVSSSMLKMAGGAAIIGFGVSALGAFNDTAKAATDMAAATGLSTEQSSRWIAVGDDLGVSAGAVQKSFGLIIKTLDKSKWDDYGIATKDAGGKLLGTNEIMLSAFDTLAKIPEGTDRAKAGNALFGKSYADLSPLIGKSRAEMEKYLGSVEKGQVITSAEAAKSKEMRLAIDNLKDSVKEVALGFGGLLASLSPVLNVLAKTIGVVTNVVSSFVGLAFGTDKGTDSIKKFFDEADRHTTVSKMGAELKQMTQDADEAHNFFARLATVPLESKWDLIRESINKMGKESPEAIGNVVAGLRSLMDAAEAGDPAAQKLVKDYELTNQHLKDLGNITLPKTIEQLTASSASMVNSQNSAEGYSYAVQSIADSAAAADQAQQDYETNNKAMTATVTHNLELIKGKWDALAGAINDDKSWANLQTGFDELTPKIDAAWKAGAKGSADAEQKARDAKVAIDDQKLAAIDYAKNVLGLPPERVTKIIAQIDAGDLAGAEAALANLTRNRNMNLSIIAKMGPGYNPFPGMPQFAEGGISRGGLSWVGEHGPEVVNLPRGTEVYTAAASRQMLVGQSNATSATPGPAGYVDNSQWVVNTPPGLSPEGVAESLRNYRRRGGRVAS